MMLMREKQMQVSKQEHKHFYIKIVLLTVTFYVGCCGTTKLPEIPQIPALKYPFSQQKQDLLVSLDPYLEKERVEKMFGIDLLSDGILPVLVDVENNSTDKSFYLQKELSSLGSESTRSPLEEPGNQKGKRIVGGVLGVGAVFSPAVGIVGLPVFIAIVDRSNTKAQTIRRNLIEKELKEKTLSPRESQRGVIFFKLPNETSLERISTIQLKVLNLESNENILFNFSINRR